jgi:hypothetical protein
MTVCLSIGIAQNSTGKPSGNTCIVTAALAQNSMTLINQKKKKKPCHTFYVAFEVVEIVAEMVQGLFLIVSPSTSALSQILDPSGRLDSCSAHDSRERNARRAVRES